VQRFDREAPLVASDLHLGPPSDCETRIAIAAERASPGRDEVTPFIPGVGRRDGGLAIARVPYGTYLRRVWPLLALLTGMVAIVLAVSAVL
jgi:uncharacterized ion transporter superfamily protein YfcC